MTYAEHLRPEGLSQGYFCYICGGVSNMYGTGHGAGVCSPNPELVTELFELNKKAAVSPSLFPERNHEEV